MLWLENILPLLGLEFRAIQPVVMCYTDYDILVPLQYMLRGACCVLVLWSPYCLLVVGPGVIRQAGRPQWTAATATEVLRLSPIWEANTNTGNNFTGYFVSGMTQVHEGCF